MKADEYECACCHGIFKLVRDETWSQEKADAEYRQLFPGANMDNREVVCDDCWKLVKPRKENWN